MNDTVVSRAGEMAVTEASTLGSNRPAGEDVDLSGLLARVREKDEAALAAFYDATSRMVYGYALRILKDPADAEEVLVDVYRQIWERASQYASDRGSALGWLMSIARSRAIDRLRRNRVHTSRQEPDETLLMNLADPAVGPEEDMISSVRRQRVGAALTQLSLEQRQLLVWAFVHGYTHSEIARLKGLPLGTVKTRIRAGLLRMRSELGELAAAL